MGISGHLDVLMWALANDCPYFVKEICRYAAMGRHLEMLRWLRANGCPWLEVTSVWAAECGQLEVLKWLLANGCPCNLDQYERIAEAKQHLDMVAWLRENKPQIL